MIPTPLCLAPFTGMHSNSERHLNPCCDSGINVFAHDMYSQEEFTKYYEDGDEAVTWNAPHWKQIRKAMYHKDWDSLPQSCVDCIKRPNSLANIEYQMHPMYKETWEKYAHTFDPETGEMSSMPIVFLILKPSNKCQAACRMCFTSVSSMKAKLMKDYDEYWSHNTDFRGNAEILEVDFEVLRRMLFNSKDSLRKVSISGGDPIQWERIDDLFDLLSQMNHQVDIDFLSNGSFNTTPRGQNIYELLSKFKNSRINFSVDGIDESFEYIRAGLKWKKLLDNIEEAATILSPQQITIHTCMNNLTCLRAGEFIQWAQDYLEPRNINFSWNIVTLPLKSVGGNLPPELKKAAVQSLFKMQVPEKYKHFKNDVIKAMMKDEYTVEQWNVFMRELEPVDKHFKRLSMATAFPELLPYKMII